MRGLGNLAFAISAFTAIGFLLWAMACLVLGYTAAKRAGLSKGSVVALSTIRAASHPVHPHVRGFLVAMAGFALSWWASFILGVWFGSIN